MASDPPTTQDLLDQVNRAIHAVMVAGQSYQIGTRQYRRADLGELKRMRAELRHDVARASSSGANGFGLAHLGGAG